MSLSAAAAMIRCAVRWLTPEALAAALIDAPLRVAPSTAATVSTGFVVTPTATSSAASPASICVASACAESCMPCIEAANPVLQKTTHCLRLTTAVDGTRVDLQRHLNPHGAGPIPEHETDTMVRAEMTPLARVNTATAEAGTRLVSRSQRRQHTAILRRREVDRPASAPQYGTATAAT